MNQFLFPAETYKRRRQKLKRLMGSGKILLPGNEESPMNYPANHYPFRQDSTFLYFFGLSRPGLVGLINVDEDEDILFGDDLTMDDIVWTGPQESMAELGARVGVSHVRGLIDLTKHLKGQLHGLPPYRSQNEARIKSWLAGTKVESTQLISPQLLSAIISLRSIKSSEEITQLHDAVTLTTQMHLAAMRYAKPGRKESEIVGQLLNVAVSNGTYFAFPPIVTVNGQTLHNHYYGNTMKEGQLLLVDSGGENDMHYAGDMTRTFPVAKTFDSRQKEIYTIVLDALKKAVDLSTEGKRNLDVHLAAAAFIFDGLKQLGLVKGDPDEAAQLGVYALFFPHGLGHMMGLDVHDMEDYGEDLVGYDHDVQRSKIFGINALRLGKKLEIGNVITIEPGIYFIPELIAQWKNERRFLDWTNYDRLEDYMDFGGIRIENNYTISPNGAQLLGEPLPMEIVEIEKIRAHTY